MNGESSNRKFGLGWVSVVKWLLFVLLFGIPLIGSWSGFAKAAESSPAGSVYVVPVKQTVESGLASFLDRAIKEAEEAKAALIVFEVDTPGGRIDTAEKIGLAIRSTEVPTVAYVTGKAASAGAYISLNADDIAMSPGSAIGAAMIVDQNGDAVENPKYVSFWSEQMAEAANLNGRDPNIAVAMVDPNKVVDLKEIGRVKAKGEILTLSATDAPKVGYSDFSAKTTEEVIAWKGLADRPVVAFDPSFAEKVSSWITSPGIATLLLIIGIAGVVIEMLVPGFGAPGIIGLVSFGLYFFGHSIAGFAGMESVVLFIIGIALLVLEMFVPSFGILGILGIAGVVSGIAMGAYDTGNALRSLGIAVIVAAVIVAVFAYVFRRRGIWNRFILRDSLTTEQGYVPNADRRVWLGKEGVSLSELRPAGVAEIEGERIDVVTSGEFVERGKPVRVVTVDGTRIVVKEK